MDRGWILGVALIALAAPVARSFGATRRRPSPPHDYVRISRALGRSRGWIARHHMAPHLLPQLVAGFVLIFPHAILHEAGLSFIGLGIEPHLPSIGVMLADSLRGLTAGHWWVALFPGLALVLLALAFETFGEALRRAADPREGVA